MEKPSREVYYKQDSKSGILSAAIQCNFFCDMQIPLLIIVILQHRLTLIKAQSLPSKWTSIDCGISDSVSY